MEQHHDTTKEGEGNGNSAAAMSRMEKRKAMKKMKRKQMRKEIAEKEREEAEARLKDTAEQERLRAAEEEEARRRERELKEFKERERAWLEAMELKRRKEEEEEAEREEEEKRMKDIEESRKLKNECDDDDGDEWEYVEEGPPEIIFQGNEIILRKKKVRVPKKSINQVEGSEIVNRPTSNPLPPETEAFADFQNAGSAQQVLENVAHQVPNFGTEQDKAHCPFHLKTGACRFGQRCSRVHFYPDKSCTLLMKNMYADPGIAWEQDEGLEVCKRCGLMMLYTEEEVQSSFEEFYEDVHTEFLKYGELVNFKVCRNGSSHLRGNVYAHYWSLESAISAYQSINGRYFAGKQVQCEFVNISRWKVAICGEFMKSRLKTCSRGSACNFIHCFRNPGGDYEWADYDKPPPRYWMRKMAVLFGYSDEYMKQRESESSGNLKESGLDSHRRPAILSRSRDDYHVSFGSTRYRSRERRGDTRERSPGHNCSKFEDHVHDKSGNLSSDIDEGSLGREFSKRTSHRESKWSDNSSGLQVTRKKIRKKYSDDDSSDVDEDVNRRESSRRSVRRGSEVREEHQDNENEQRTLRSHANGILRKRNREGSSTDHGESNFKHRINKYRDRTKHRCERNRSRSSPLECSDEDLGENRHHPHKRKGSDSQDDDSEGYNVQENNRGRLHSNRTRRHDPGNSEHRKHDSDHETHSDATRTDRSKKRKRHEYHTSSVDSESTRGSPGQKKENFTAPSEEKTREESRHRHRRRDSRQRHKFTTYPKDNKSEANPNKSSANLVCEPVDDVDKMDRWKPDCLDYEIP